MTPTTTSSSSKSIMEVRLANWSGQIPVRLELAPTCLSSPTMPPPIHMMVSRQSYLHISLESAVRRLYQFAAPVILGGRGGTTMLRAQEPLPGENSSGDNSDDEEKKKKNAVVNNDDDNNEDKAEKEKEETANTNNENENNNQQAYPICWFEDEERQMPLRWHLFAGCLYDMMHKDNNTSHNKLPWKIRLQFGETNYPTGVLLPLDGPVLELVERYYQNQLKQALCLETGSAKVALQGLTKQSHEQIWNSIRRSSDSTANNGVLYHQVNQIHDYLLANNNNNNRDESSSLQRLPIRVLLDYSQPPSQPSTAANTTLGEILLETCPSLFRRQEEADDKVVEVGSSQTTWTIQGISQIPLSTPLLLLWQTLCHPDHFLYILVRNNTAD